MVRALRVDHFEPNGIAAEEIFVSEEDVYLDLTDWKAGKAEYNAVEDSPTRLELFLFDLNFLHGVAVEDVDAATAVYQDPGKTAGPPLG